MSILAKNEAIELSLRSISLRFISRYVVAKSFTDSYENPFGIFVADKKKSVLNASIHPDFFLSAQNRCAVFHMNPEGVGSLSLHLHGSGRFAREIVEYAVYAADFVDDAAHNAL